MLSTALIFAGFEIIVILYQSQSSPFASIFHPFLLCYHHLHYRFRNRSLCSSALSKIRSIVFHPDPSMPCLHLAFLLVIAWAFFYSGTKCIDQWYEDCLHNSTHCGNTSISYPFGLGNHGCGDPHFQLYCVKNKPVLSVNTKNYSILEPNYLGLYNANHTITIVNEKLLQQKCDLSNDYDDLSSNAYFNITQEYTHNLILLQCDETPPFPFFRKLNCSSSWYYGWTLPTNWDIFCKLHSELPVTVDGSDLSLLPPNFLHQGVQIEWYTNESRDQSCIDCESTMGICGYDFLDPQQPFVCICEDASHLKNCDDGGIIHRSKSRQSRRGIIIIGGSVGGIMLIGVVLLCRVFCRRRRNSQLIRSIVSNSNCEESKDTEACAPALTMGSLPIFSYEELEWATNCFDEKNELGDGGFGTVYLGRLRDGRAVAVKKLYQDNSRRVEQFINEVQILSSLHHPNLVRLFGCTCPDSRELLLVYEYVPNGTLADHLHGERKGIDLSWDIRLKIAIQTARALAFLHNVEPPIFHRDVKSTNILLDENFEVKLADFGLSKLVPIAVTHVTTVPQGTPGYLDPDYHRCYQLTEKSDVYSFGVVLVEIISAKLAVDVTRTRMEISLANMAIAKIQNGALDELVDPNLGMESTSAIKVMVTAVAELAFRCLANDKDDRPYMKEVAAQLEHIKQMARADACSDINSEIQQKLTVLTGVAPYSPTSVQEKWLSTNTTPDSSA